ncbi:MAG TPA: hypothetical protein VK530_17415, partial [Candidatus Acidoferrum sp.]|nr:hypothetical protein [Candidatus Acidoferrum sp.]
VFALLVHRLIQRELRKRQSTPTPIQTHRHSTSSLFEPPARWLAVRTQNPRLVQNALGVQHPRACAWSDALSTPFEPRLFISPPVRGWVLVMGCDLPDPTDDVDKCFLFLTHLSQKLGEVQLFTRNRVVCHHGWVRCNAGKVLRAYVWAGETLWNQGPATEVERDLKLRCLGYAEDSDVLGLAGHELLSLNTERVVRIAGAWSLDPTNVEADALDAKGIAGDLLHSKLH